MTLFNQVWSIQGIRFLVIGSINTGFSYLVYVLFLFLGLDYPQANLLAMISGVLFGFLTNSKLVFKFKGNFLKYLMLWFALYIVNIGIIWLFVSFNCTPYLAGFLALPIITLFSYIAQKNLIFLRN